MFVLTHHPREPVTMNGGTTFHFVTEGVDAALARAFEAAAGSTSASAAASTPSGSAARTSGGRAAPRGRPGLLGTGERLFDGVDAAAAGYECVELTASPAVAHVRLRRAG